MNLTTPLSSFTGSKTRIGQFSKHQRAAMDLFVSDPSKLWYKAVSLSDFEAATHPATRRALAQARVTKVRRSRSGSDREVILTGFGKTIHGAMQYLRFRLGQRSVGR